MLIVLSRVDDGRPQASIVLARRASSRPAHEQCFADDVELESWLGRVLGAFLGVRVTIEPHCRDGSLRSILTRLQRRQLTAC
jgi:hypothetical protein